MTGRAQVIEFAGFWPLECDFLAIDLRISLESQVVFLLARADAAGEFCDATTRATADQ